MKKQTTALLILLLLFFTGYTQELSDIGIFAGGSYYLGEINPGKQFYSPNIAIGLMYRYNFNKRYSLKANFSYTDLTGDDADFDNTFQQERGTSFNNSVFDCAVQTEFNFLPFNNTTTEKENLTPYLTAGLGFMILSNSSFTKPLTFPFGVGVKYTPKKRLTLGLEWSFRKTFNDEIDGIVNITDDNNKPFIHNKDWYSFAGLVISYKFFRNREDCPTYWE